MSVGLKCGLSAGLPCGTAAGIGADPFGAPATGGIAGVTRDAGNLNYYPASSGEWTTFLSSAGLAAGNPSSLWLCQEASGNLADSIGAITLTNAGNLWTLYQQIVTGAARRGVKGTDAVANQRFLNNTTAVNPSTSSTLVLAYVEFPVVPGGTRGLFGVGQTNAMLRWLSSGKIRIVGGATTDSVLSVSSTATWVALRVDNTAGTITMFTLAEKLVGTFTTPTSANLVLFGGDGASQSCGAYTYAYLCEFSGASAERSDAEMRTLLQTLSGTTVPW